MAQVSYSREWMQKTHSGRHGRTSRTWWILLLQRFWQQLFRELLQTKLPHTKNTLQYFTVKKLGRGTKAGVLHHEPFAQNNGVVKLLMPNSGQWLCFFAAATCHLYIHLPSFTLYVQSVCLTWRAKTARNKLLVLPAGVFGCLAAKVMWRCIFTTIRSVTALESSTYPGQLIWAQESFYFIIRTNTSLWYTEEHLNLEFAAHQTLL